MSRWIDADALKDYYVDLSTEKDIGYGDMGRMITVNINHIIKTIEEAPSIDIVRCKECKRHGRDDCPMWEGMITEDYMFCSCGERKK